MDDLINVDGRFYEKMYTGTTKCDGRICISCAAWLNSDLCRNLPTCFEKDEQHSYFVEIDRDLALNLLAGESDKYCFEEDSFKEDIF